MPQVGGRTPGIVMGMAEPFLGILSLADLRAIGHTRYSIADALATADLERVRRGWFAQSTADPDARAAARIGGVLTATSASRHYGMWTPDDDLLHVVVSRHASRLRLDGPANGRRPNVCVHWAAGRLTAKAIAEPLQVVKDAAHCRAFEDAVAIADSALNKRLIRLSDLRASIPSLAAWCDPASQSGTETLSRVRLRRRNVRVRTQVRIARVGSVDLIVGDRLVIECDSVAFHENYQSARDYDRDMALVSQGYIVLRLKYHHVMYDWAQVEALILAIVRARRHLWRRGGSAGTVVSL
jgi:very-short-patch-repair endonuclease